MYNVYLVQANYQIGKGQYSSHWLPYSIAALWAYVEQFDQIKQNFQVIECIFKREEISDITARMIDPDFCLFSNYIWNENYNLLLAEAIKKIWPNCKIIFGGPQVDDNGEKFLNQHKFVDSIVINEGEKSLTKLFNDILENKEIRPIYEVERRVELENMPSPYIDSEIMNNILKNNPNTKWATTIETNRGCPFSCTFCDWGSLTQSKIKKFNLEKVFKEIDWIAENKIEYVYLADANFGVFYDRDKTVAEYLAKIKKITGYPLAFNATYYKNSASKTIDIAEIIQNVGLNRGLTLSAQSMNQDVLTIIERQNMDVSKLSLMYKECDRRGVRYYTEFILGLPLETAESWKAGLCEVIEAGCHGMIEAYPLDVLKNSELSNQINQHKLEIGHYNTVVPNQPSQVFEKHNYVISTKYMNREDFITSWMWIWLLNNFHHYGWTQMLSKFARKQNISYLQFYEDFLNQCIFNDDFFKQQYNKKKNNLERFFWHKEITDVYRDDNINLFSDQHIWHKNREHIENCISKWALQYFKKYTLEFITQLINFNFNYVTNISNKNKLTIHHYDYNILEYCHEELIEFKMQSNTYKFENQFEWIDDDNFYEQLHFKIRHGFAIQKVTNIT